MWYTVNSSAARRTRTGTAECSSPGRSKILLRLFCDGILKEVYTMIWAKEETLPRDEIEAIQFAKLKGTVRYIYDRVKPYRE